MGKKTLKENGKTIKITEEAHVRLKDCRYSLRVDTLSDALVGLLDFYEAAATC